MMFGTIVLFLPVLLLIGGIAAWPRSRNQAHLNWYKISVSQEETGAMNILEHSAQGATIRLDQRELLLVMALIQEGRESFGCNSVSGRALDSLFSSANVMVERARRRHLKQFVVWQKIHPVAAPELH